MYAEILFLEILSFGVKIKRNEVKISHAKRRRLKKKARRDLSTREDDGAVRIPVNQSMDGLSRRLDGLSPVIGMDDPMKKRKPEPFQLLDELTVMEDEGTLLDELPVMEDEDNLLDELPVVEDEDTVLWKSVSPSSLLSPLVAGHTIMTNESSFMPPCLPNTISTYTQNTVPPSFDLIDDEGPLSSDEHCLVKTRLGTKKLEAGQRRQYY